RADRCRNVGAIAHLLHDALADCKAEARPLRPGGEEGDEEVSSDRWRDTGAMVGDRNLHTSIRSLGAPGPGGDGDGPAPPHGLAGVADQFEQDLAEWLRVRAHARHLPVELGGVAAA